MNGHKAKAIMVLGTGSGVGKSFVTAGLCRIFSDAGVRVAPFKAQNMSNNSFVTREGGEMGRAQVVQAECARVEPSVHMNPVLLKPASDNGSQVIVHGRSIGTFKANKYYGMKQKIQKAIQESYEKLSREFDCLVIEGAGSPAEINLKDHDLVNFHVAEMADARCVLVGDIDRGGVFAWFVGTLALLDESERERIVGLVINKFRGDIRILEAGLERLENLSGKKVLGTIPYERDLWIEEEDTVGFDCRGGPPCPPDEVQPQRAALTVLDIAVLLLPRISNATDFQILAEEAGVSVRMISRLEEFGTPDLFVLPGTKATLADLNYLKQTGFADRIQNFVQKGGRVLGICGGFQMLGETIEDPAGVESSLSSVPGLGLLPVRTQFFNEKTLTRVIGCVRTQIFSYPVEGKLSGYEIHMGKTERGAGARPLFEVFSEEWGQHWRAEGAIDATGKVLGTYLHGLFDDTGFRSSFLDALWKSTGKKRPHYRKDIPSISFFKERNYNRLAELLKKHLNMDFIQPCLNSSLHSS